MSLPNQSSLRPVSQTIRNLKVTLADLKTALQKALPVTIR